MKILVTGAAGLLGRGLTQVFAENHQVISLTRKEGDITDLPRMREVIGSTSPDAIVHTAAMPDIDECEQNPEPAWRINAEGTRGLVEIASEFGCAFALISTDAVFDGKSSRPYRESDAVNPPSVYGKTKVAAEEHTRKYTRHWIFRVSVLFGPGKVNFVSKAWHKAMENESSIVANDQLGSATYTLDAARTMSQVMSAGTYGTYHLCNQGACTRYDLARRAVEIAGMDTALVIGKSMQEMNRPGPRLQYSVMEMDALQKQGIALPRNWEDALREYYKTEIF